MLAPERHPAPPAPSSRSPGAAGPSRGRRPPRPAASCGSRMTPDRSPAPAAACGRHAALSARRQRLARLIVVTVTIARQSISSHMSFARICQQMVRLLLMAAEDQLKYCEKAQQLRHRIIGWQRLTRRHAAGTAEEGRRSELRRVIRWPSIELKQAASRLHAQIWSLQRRASLCAYATSRA